MGAVAVSGSRPDTVYVGMGESELRGNIIQGDGIYKSTDGGHTWTAQNFSTAQLYHVSLTANLPYKACGAQQDNTTVCVPSIGSGSSFYQVGGGESGYVAADPKNPNIFYAGAYGEYMTWYDHSTKPEFRS